MALPRATGFKNNFGCFCLLSFERYLSAENQSESFPVVKPMLIPMKIQSRITAFLLFILFFASFQLNAQAQKPDTVKVGIYITSIHDIDFKQKEFSTNLWLWMKYKNPRLNFLDNLEIPGAKSVEKSFATIDSSGEEIYLQMKLQCVMKDSWRIGNFPFDHQNLRFSIENSQFDAKRLVFIADTVGN